MRAVGPTDADSLFLSRNQGGAHSQLPIFCRKCEARSFVEKGLNVNAITTKHQILFNYWPSIIGIKYLS